MTDRSQSAGMQAAGAASRGAYIVPQWDKWTRQLVTVLLIVLGLFAVTLVAPVLQTLIIAFLLAFVLFVPIRSLTRRLRLPYALSVLLVYLALIVLIIVVILLVLPAMIDGIEALSGSIQTGLVALEGELRPYLQDGVNTVEAFGVTIDLAFILDPIRQALGTFNQISQETTPPAETGIGVPEAVVPETIIEEANEPDPTTPTVNIGSSDLRSLINSLFSLAGTVTETLTSALTGVAGFVTSFLLALFISFLVLLDVPSSARTLDKWIPDAYNREYALLVQKIVRVWNGFFKGQIIIGLFIGILTWLQLSLMGVSNAALLAVIIGTISLIPTIGGFIALIPLSIIPLLTGSNAEVFANVPNGIFALLVVILNLFISQLIWNVIAPKILGDALNLPVAVIIIGVFIGAAVGGILGAFLVAPIMSTLRIVIIYLMAKINQRDPFPGEGVAILAGVPPFTPTDEPIPESVTVVTTTTTLAAGRDS